MGWVWAKSTKRSKPKWLDRKKVVAGGRRGDTVTRRRGDAVAWDGWISGRGRDSDCVAVGVVCLVVKDQGGQLLTGVGGDGGAEDGVCFLALRHGVLGVRSGWFGWLRNRRRRGLRGLCRLWTRLEGLAFLLRLLHVRDGGAEGALQLGAVFGNVTQHFKAFFAECDRQVDPLLALGNAAEQPLGGDHGFQVAAFGAGLRLPVGVQFVPELGVVRGVFVGEDEGAGAQAVG